MARKTRKMKTSIQLSVLNGKGKGNSISAVAIIANPQLDSILAAVLRVFAARGRAIRETRTKLEALQPQDTDAPDVSAG